MLRSILTFLGSPSINKRLTIIKYMKEKIEELIMLIGIFIMVIIVGVMFQAVVDMLYEFYLFLIK